MTPQTDEPTFDGTRWSNADSDRIEFVVHGAGADEQMRLERTATGWRMRQPSESRVDAAAVAAFLCEGFDRLR